MTDPQKFFIKRETHPQGQTIIIPSALPQQAPADKRQPRWYRLDSLQDLTRIIELLDAAAEIGADLPMPPADIIQLEKMGMVVDLLTGEIFQEDPIGLVVGDG